jgi:type II secretory pathway pseudopilin PulG
MKVVVRRDAGFTLIEITVIMALSLIVAATIVPRIGALMKSQRARNGAQIVETQMQTARLRADAVSRPLRVRFSCPSTGTLRVLELTGVAATDSASNRCSPTAFPYPGPRDALRATPSLDGPVVYLPSGVSVSGAIMQFEFTPRGEVYAVAADGSTSLVTGDATLTVSYGTWTNTVKVNALGRIRLN